MKRNKTADGLIIAIAIGVTTLLVAPERSAQAATFDYSYTFDTGQVISGSFTGDQSGQNITDIANITASLNGTPFTGPLYAMSYTGAPNACNSVSCFSGTGAIVSFNAQNNNFLFLNTDSPTDFVNSNYANVFYIIPYGGSERTSYYQPPTNTFIDYDNEHYIPNNWVLTAAVPEPSTWAMMILGLFGVGFIAYLRKVALRFA